MENNKVNDYYYLCKNDFSLDDKYCNNYFHHICSINKNKNDHIFWELIEKIQNNKNKIQIIADYYNKGYKEDIIYMLYEYQNIVRKELKSLNYDIDDSSLFCFIMKGKKNFYNFIALFSSVTTMFMNNIEEKFKIDENVKLKNIFTIAEKYYENEQIIKKFNNKINK